MHCTYFPVAWGTISLTHAKFTSTLLSSLYFRKISHALYILNNAPIGFVIILIDLLSLPGILS